MFKSSSELLEEIRKGMDREIMGIMFKNIKEGLMQSYIAVDFDGTLATYTAGDFHKYGPLHMGEPIPAMVERVKGWRAAGTLVKILTARVNLSGSVSDIAIRLAIQEWCLEHLGEILEITCIKDYGMLELWDDRAVAVETNTGKHLGGGRIK